MWGREVIKIKELILVDGSSYLFRAFHALPPLINSRGQSTGAVKGVINMTRALLKKSPHKNIAMVFDAKGKTFRNDLYPDYKSNRPPMPEELRSQITPIHEIITAMGIPLIIVEGVEADDVIGTLANQATAMGIRTLISTGDKDLAQLVNSNVALMNTMTNEELDEGGVLKKFGVRPARIIDYLALMGDKSDNIPGVPGVGPKTAVKWLLEYDSMEGIIENASAIGGKVGERLRENIEQLKLSYELATIKLDVDVGVSISSLTKQAENQQELYGCFTKLEFKTWIRELEDSDATGALRQEPENIPKEVENLDDSLRLEEVSVPKVNYSIIKNAQELDSLQKALEKSNRFSINVESQGPHFLDAQIVGVSVSCELGASSYIPIGHSYEGCPEQFDLKVVLEKLKPAIEKESVRKFAYDTKHVSHLLQTHGIKKLAVSSDVLLASYVLNSVATKHGLSDIIGHYLNATLTDPDELLGKGRKRLVPSLLSIGEYAVFANEKADFIHRVALVLDNKLSSFEKLQGVYRYFELPLVGVLQRIERNGISLDKNALKAQSVELEKSLNDLQQRIYDIAGEEFNIGSPKQLQAIFYDKLQLPILKKTPKGQPSTAEPVLQELAEDYELPRFILEHRSLSKLKSTYTDKLPLEVNNSTGRIHSTFQQAVTATGRLSSADPNLQNIPIRTEEGRKVRRAFISNQGYKLMAADYSQVELRIMAHLSRDPGLLSAFDNEQDVHKATAADVFGVELDYVTSDQRRSAKAINFGLIYGMSAFGLAKQLNVSRTEAQEYVDRYFEKYPGVKVYMEQTQAFADEKGYVETIFGRRLYLPEIRSGNAMVRKAAQRTAINAPMQGSAADIIKLAMIDIDQWLELGDLDARLVLQVHDELVFEVKDRDAALLGAGVRFRMMSAASLEVPLVVDIGVGDNWDQAH